MVTKINYFTLSQKQFLFKPLGKKAPLPPESKWSVRNLKKIKTREHSSKHTLPGIAISF